MFVYKTEWRSQSHVDHNVTL